MPLLVYSEHCHSPQSSHYEFHGHLPDTSEQGKLLHIHWLDFIWLPQSCSSGALVSEKESHSRSPIRFRSILSFQVCCDIYSYTIYIVIFELVESFPECDLLPLSTTISKNLQINFFNFLLHNFHSLIKCCPVLT